ncbi:hypothetical protein [Cytobacillus dafuensis]|uniref:Uncharacterized protein n=1 Tax=Cytobacillus dafuensis TaxID=1742359 RepID=A0A5B8ZCS4_CYTDA|nr:hypothetical protein [Cytobacillus dafuensis]QED49569.1 hypothetical protein FSZ17_21155 [Cytobacillus dafuensis]
MEQSEIPDTGDAWLDIQTLFGRMLDSLTKQFANEPTSANRFIAAVIDIEPIRERYEKNFIELR